MTPLAAPLSQLVLSLFAVAGLAILHRSLLRQSPDDPITRRFVFGIRATALLFAGRALIVLTGASWLAVLVHLAAALVPLAVLLLTEGLLRRHAPGWAKALAVVGTVLFLCLAPMPAPWVEPARSWALLVYQIAMLATCGWLVATRDRASLSPGENRTAGLLSLSLILLIPLVAVDFVTHLIALPVQLSALGVLVLCWLAAGLGRPAQTYREPLVTFAWLAVAALLAGTALGLIFEGGWRGGVIAGAMVAAAALVVMILAEAQHARREAQNLTLLHYMATAPADHPLTFLAGLRRHPAVEGAALIDRGTLADLDAAAIHRLMTAHPILRRADPPPLDPDLAQHADHLFARYAASHIIAVGRRHRRLVALNMPALATSPRHELELRAVQRMAALMEGEG